MRMTRSKGGIEVMAVVWEQRGASQGRFWELVAFEPDLRGRVGIGGWGTSQVSWESTLKGLYTPDQGVREVRCWGQGVLDICLGFRKLFLAAVWRPGVQGGL